MSIQTQHGTNHSIHSSTLADVLERILDKGLVIAGDIKVKLVDIELLTIQIRLVVCSVDKAREMGIDFWTTNSNFSSNLASPDAQSEVNELNRRLAPLEAQASGAPALVSPPAVVAQAGFRPANPPPPR